MKAQLAHAASGEAFLLQGDRAESFAEFHANALRDSVKVLLQMAVVLSYAGGVPVVKVAHGRPVRQAQVVSHRNDRSSHTAHIVAIVNEITFDGGTATRSTQDAPGLQPVGVTLNLLRAFTQGGFADLARVQWNQAFIAASQGERW